MDTITLVRSALRGLLRVAGDELAAELRAVLSSGDDYASTAKPHIDWDDDAARGQLIDSRARDIGDSRISPSSRLMSVPGPARVSTMAGLVRDPEKAQLYALGALCSRREALCDETNHRRA